SCSLLLQRARPHLSLLSFPTRRSSDLDPHRGRAFPEAHHAQGPPPGRAVVHTRRTCRRVRRRRGGPIRPALATPTAAQLSATRFAGGRCRCPSKTLCSAHHED